ncbi:MAG: branched-chain amino acid ABC transporter permease [Thermodesulfobacteriota bacterium]|jgi:branched-chain amino acid transport system permease protein
MKVGEDGVEIGIIINQIIWGVLVGVSYSLLAISFSLIFAAAGTINFANGEFAMLGAYFCYTIVSRLQGSILLGAFVAIFLCFLFGVIVERLAFRKLYKLDPVLIVIATIGISTILKNLVLIIWGSFSQSFPEVIKLETIRVGSLTIVPLNMILLIVGVFVMVVFHLFMTRTRMGTAMRATAQNNKAASLMGVNTRRTISLTWALGSLIAGIGGILIGFIYNLSIEMGSLLGIKGFASAVIGGFGNIAGAMFGGILMGITENLGAFVVSFYYKDLIAFLILIVILLLKPTGLFIRGRAFRRV